MTEKEEKRGPIRFKTCFRNTIYDAMKARGWKEVEPDAQDAWDFHWTDRDMMFEVFDTTHLTSWQRVNHFRNCRELCRKDLLVKNLKRQKRQLMKRSSSEEADLYNFWPTSFVLPGDYALFAEEFKRQPNSMWIMKPISRSQGKGIFIFQKLSQISKWKSENRWKPEKEDAETYVAQQYINDPFLVGGRKFDLRLYVLVTSFNPLTVWLFRGGFCRFTTYRYSNAPADISNHLMHLTNVAIQKKSELYDENVGGKWDVKELKLYLISMYGVEVVDSLFSEIQMVVLRSLLAVQPVMINDKHCFELYGYDILIDSKLKPWLLEINASPSLSANTPADYDLKLSMLSSCLDVVDMEGKLQGDEQRVGGFDLIYRNGHIGLHPDDTYTTMLGAHIPSDPHIERMKTLPAVDATCANVKRVGAASVATEASKARMTDNGERRALVVEEPGGRVGLQHKPRLHPGRNEVLIAPAFVGVCGTDLELIGGQADPAFVKYPVTLGHEWCGYISAVGEGVQGLSPGDHVVGEGIVPCLECDNCDVGATNTCSTYEEIGFTREGAASDHLLVPSHLVHRLQPHVSPQDAALCEPCAVVQRALLKARPSEGSRVLVVGDGTVGMLACHLASRLYAPKEVVLLGLRQEQAPLAEKAGATLFTCSPDEAGSGFDLVLEAAGASEAVTTALKKAGRGGTVVLLGLPASGATSTIHPDEIVYNDLTIFGSFSYTRAAWASVVDLLNRSIITPSILVSHTYDLEEWQKALDALRGVGEGEKGGPRGKVLLRVHGPRVD